MTIEKCNPELLNELAEMRARVMKPSLEKVGRYDDKRVRDRLTNEFNSGNCRILKHDDKLLGFYYIVESESEINLKHLYVDIGYQKLGFGTKALDIIKTEAKGKTIKVNALKESPSNSFYQRNGFKYVYEDEFDIYYSYTF